MSVDVTKAVFAQSRAKGNARLVLHALGDAVNHEQLRTGIAGAEAWVSQVKLAKLCNCKRDTVRAGLDELVALGEIEDTGERKGREVIVWRILLELPEPGEWSND